MNDSHDADGIVSAACCQHHSLMDVTTAYKREMGNFREFRANGERDAAWLHLERAHILSQRHLLRHAHVHILMLGHGLGGRDGREVRGQLLRLAAVPVAWITGWVPEGNTGGANVSALRPMDPPDDLRGLVSGRAPWWQGRQRS